MITTDILSNFFSNLINNSKAKKYKTIQFKTKIIIHILNIFFKKGLIKGYSFSKKNPYFIYIYLKYANNKPVLEKIQRISKPGKRVYIKNKDLFKDSNNHFYIISTPKGILTNLQAKKYNLGGEIICKIN